ncbi:hypothetical protein V6N12_043514 [Hibiscus sabdariffa]|uniref:RNase H type-1 domain-containing protein n=1 Tax=Hibiscus sabdariffa TaxID=183260 RepID=A0ABR2DEJ3_9ROSI
MRDGWQVTKIGWVKKNVDGVVGTNRDMAVVGGVIRDAQGEWIFDFARSLGVCSIPMSELWIVHDMLIHFGRLGLCKIVIETYNVMVTDIIHGKSKALVECALWPSSVSCWLVSGR